MFSVCILIYFLLTLEYGSAYYVLENGNSNSGMIAGIVIGVLVALVVSVILGLIFMRRR